MTTIAIIPARGGSRRIPRKNIQDFHGKPIMAYSIENAKASGLFDKIVVSTDDSVIGLVAEFHGAEVWLRSPGFGRDEVGTHVVTGECLYGLRAHHWDVACCLYATAPLLSVQDLTAGYQMLRRGASYAFSVGYPPLHDAGQFYWGFAGKFMSDVPLINLDTRMVKVDESRDCDINTWEDWNRALEMYERLPK